jgi:flavocytochrome c
MAKTTNYQTDVAIIGGGAAGICAALDAHDAGAATLVFEKLGEPGGAAIISGGGCCMAGTPLQEKLGIADNPDIAFDDWMKWGGPSADAEWARFYLEGTRNDLFIWAERHGVKWVDAKPQEGNSVVRWQRAEQSGLGLMTALIASYRKQGGRIIPDTQVTALTRDASGRVIGFEGVDAKTGDRIAVKAKTVVVASGGFNSNVDMVLEYKPELRGSRIMEGSGFGSTGDGHKLVTSMGGYLTHMDHVWFYVYATPDYRDPRQRRGLVFRLAPGNIYVNQQGKRFHNESLSGGNSASPAILAQQPKHAWAVFDRPMLAKMEISDPYYRSADKPVRERIEELLDNSPFIKKADTLEALADKMDVPRQAFLETVARYNKAFDDRVEKEPDFGKPLKLSKKFDTAPYYAIQMFPLARKNFGGVKTDKHCRVLDKHFEPIPGLYAAGEVAGMAGGHINGKAGLEGTMLGPSLFSGRVAGAWAAHEAGYGKGFVGKPHRG